MQMPLRPSRLATLGLALLLSGCQGSPFDAPRPIAEQQYEAQRFDPLPEPDTAPEIVGARGREYERPIAQPSRARWDPRTWVQRIGF